MLVYCPSKFIIQFPSDNSHKRRSYSDNTRNGYKEWLNRSPDMKVNIAFFVKVENGSLDLVHLYCGIDEETDIVNPQADDLNGVL